MCPSNMGKNRVANVRIVAKYYKLKNSSNNNVNDIKMYMERVHFLFAWMQVWHTAILRTLEMYTKHKHPM